MHAHRDHAYQSAVQSGMAHAAVTLIVGAISAALIPVAYAAWRWPSWSLGLLGVSLALLGVLYAAADARRSSRATST